MKKISNYIFVIILLFSAHPAFAQLQSRIAVETTQKQVKKENGMISIAANLKLENLDLKSQDMIVLTPVLRSLDNKDSHTFQPIVITGSTRDKALQRALGFGNYQFETEPQLYINYKKNTATNIPLNLSMPYEKWMQNASLIIEENSTGCACENLFNDKYTVLTPILPPVFNPNYELSYVTPPVEEVKQRSESHSARINFELAKYKILRNFKNNAEVLDEVDKVINEIRNDANLTVTDFTITGYASPEGNPKSNMILSENRAKAFVSYLMNNYSIPEGSMITNWKGEDWDGLRKAVDAGYLSDKAQILDILDNENNVMARKSKIQKLSGGETYRILLQDYYPPLRRNDYTITFIARSFSVDEARELIKTKPQYLSQNEMFLVATSYPKDSPEFKDVFDTAVRIYPNNPIAQLNTAALEIENGAIDNAIGRLEKIDMPEAWNNLGIAYVKKKDYTSAKQYFDKAAASGLTTGRNNAEQLSKWIESQP